MPALDKQIGYHLQDTKVSAGSSQVGGLLAVGVGVVLGVLSWVLMGQAGLSTVMLMLGVAVAGIVLSYVSWQNTAILVSLWIFSMSGFRAYAMIYMPVLPDISLERVIMLWLLIIFVLRLMMKRDTFRGPYAVDIVLIMHVLYILANVTYIGHRVHLHEWAVSSVTPLVAYFVGKNMMARDREVRFLFIALLVILTYYNVQSIAQKFDLNFLIWPKSILDRSLGVWPLGRSRGPFLSPPLFGQMISLFIPVQFYFFYRIKTTALRVMILASIAASGLAIFYTYTRGPWLATAMALLVLGFLRPRYRQLLAALGVLLAVAGFVGLLQAANTELLHERFTNTQTIGNRLAAMSAALRMWMDHPLFGVGYFNWEQYYPLYHRGEDVPFFGYVTRYMGRGVVIHDIYWGRLAEEGLISLGLLAAAVALVWHRFKYLWARVHESDWINRDCLAVFVAVFVSYAVGGLIVDYRYFDLVNAMPYLLAGVLMGYRIPDHPPPPPPYRNWTPPDFWPSDGRTGSSSV